MGGLFGFYRAKCIEADIEDNDYGAVRVWIPDLHTDLDPDGIEDVGLIALPGNNPVGGRNNEDENSYGWGTVMIPRPGDWIWVFFEAGDPSKPFYFSALNIKNAKIPPENRVNQEGSKPDEPHTIYTILKTHKGRSVIVADSPDVERIEISGKYQSGPATDEGGDSTDPYTIDGNQTTILFDERASQVSGEEINEKLTQEHEGCYACPIRCGRLTKAGDMKGKGPEYESVWALGPNLGIYDLIKVTQANYLCNKYGLDSISCGGSIACAMELQEKGLLNDSTIKFGNNTILQDLVRKIALKEDIGAQICDGSRNLSKTYNSEELAMHVKGLELPAYDPRGAIGHALGYATSNRGGCHLTGYMASLEIFAAPKKIDRFTMAGKPDLLVLKQNQKAIEDSLVICAFAGWALGLDYYARFMKAITGIDFDVIKLLKIGERIYNLERLFNIKEGLTREDDTLPQRFMNEPLTEGFSKDHVVPLEKMLGQYYYVREWDNNGIPKPELLERLGINQI